MTLQDYTSKYISWKIYRSDIDCFLLDSHKWFAETTEEENYCYFNKKEFAIKYCEDILKEDLGNKYNHVVIVEEEVISNIRYIKDFKKETK